MAAEPQAMLGVFDAELEVVLNSASIRGAPLSGLGTQDGVSLDGGDKVLLKGKYTADQYSG